MTRPECCDFTKLTPTNLMQNEQRNRKPTPRLYVNRIIYIHIHIGIQAYISIELSVYGQKAVGFMRFVVKDKNRYLRFYFSTLLRALSFLFFKQSWQQIA